MKNCCDHSEASPITQVRNKKGCPPDKASVAKKGEEIMELMLGFQKSQILYTAGSLGVFEELRQTAPLNAKTLSRRIKTDSDATCRLLNACVSLGLLVRETAKDGEAVYSNSPGTEMFLTKSSPFQMRPMMMLVREMYPLWAKLPDAVRDGNSKKGKGDLVQNFMEGSDDGYFQNEASKIEFLQAMHMMSTIDAPAVLASIDLSEFTNICDLGGGSGALAAAIAKAHPKANVSVMELPPVVKCAKLFLPEDSTVQYITGDMFNDDLPPADLFILSHVIHDWNLEKINFLLRKIYRALDIGGAVLVLEKILDDNRSTPIQTVLMDVAMMIGTQGRERSREEYMELLNLAKFKDIEIKIVHKSRNRDAILARKTDN